MQHPPPLATPFHTPLGLIPTVSDLPAGSNVLRFSEGELKLLELNPFSGADLACDTDAVVDGIGSFLR